MEFIRDVDDSELLKDYVMNVNEFNEQQVLYEERALINMFLNLVFMQKGTIQKMPDMGFDIQSKKHKLQRVTELRDMERELREQIRNYLPGTFSNISLRSENQKGDVVIKAVTKTNKEMEFSFNRKVMLDNIRIKLPDKKFQ